MGKYDFRLLNRDNINDLMELEKRCFSDDLAETEESFLNAVAIYPEGAKLLYIDNKIAGTIFFHPYFIDKVQKLKDSNTVLTGKEDCMYLHSFSIHPEYRGKGLTHILFSHFNEVSERDGYDCQALVAVQNSERFWAKYGFESVRQIIYGDSLAVYMIRNIIDNDQ